MEQLSERVSRVETQMDQLRQELKGEISQLAQKVDKNFLWTMGILITMWISIIIAVLVKG